MYCKDSAICYNNKTKKSYFYIKCGIREEMFEFC